ncbi:hypothetical protein Ppa06_16380 [Planomonospora parontospora subsp. parontospora]|uniref:Uncharacterized protein n=2 Tax=Planomonospora parontospora TaxID=58119 RepID=A0AA37BEG0_9ACTN|nr:hypothetical protein GCM10010126_16930 [Planomonospora parontospora]GII07840.1 hypothetical protein Ppa06_16380 [Planomonospora parontospora subsp. parontospora]
MPQTTGKRVVRCGIGATFVSSIEKLAGAEVLAFGEDLRPLRSRHSGNHRPAFREIGAIFAVSKWNRRVGGSLTEFRPVAEREFEYGGTDVRDHQG